MCWLKGGILQKGDLHIAVFGLAVHVDGQMMAGEASKSRAKKKPGKGELEVEMENGSGRRILPNSLPTLTALVFPIVSHFEIDLSWGYCLVATGGHLCMLSTWCWQGMDGRSGWQGTLCMPGVGWGLSFHDFSLPWGGGRIK